MSIFDSLESRRAELKGDIAAPNDVAQLHSILKGRMPDLLRAYRELPICQMNLAFRVRDGGLSASPEIYAPTIREEFDREFDHEFIWMSPIQIVEEIQQAYVGLTVFNDGYVPIGWCTGGGDSFFLRFGDNGETMDPLFNVYYDWINTKDINPLPEQAVHVIWPSVIEVLEIAYIWR